MLGYLYYKLYRAAKASSLNSTAEFKATIFFGGLIAANIFVLTGYFDKLNILPFMFSNKNQASLFGVICIAFTSFYFLNNKRYKLIIKKYTDESDKQRIKGNILVAIYVAISFLSIFAIAFFRNGEF